MFCEQMFGRILLLAGIAVLVWSAVARTSAAHGAKPLTASSVSRGSIEIARARRACSPLPRLRPASALEPAVTAGCAVVATAPIEPCRASGGYVRANRRPDMIARAFVHPSVRSGSAS